MFISPHIPAEIAGKACVLTFDFAAAYTLETRFELSWQKLNEQRWQGEQGLELVRKLIFACTRSMPSPPSARFLERLKADDLRELADSVRLAVAAALERLEPPPKLRDGGAKVRAPQKSKESAWDWRRAMEQAINLLEITPAEFWRLTLAEYELRVAGAARRLEGQQRFLAAMTANIMNASGNLRRRVTAEQLMGKPVESSSEGYAGMSPSGQKKALDQVWKKVERNRKKKKAGAQ